jgi:hypothetical protein
MKGCLGFLFIFIHFISVAQNELPAKEGKVIFEKIDSIQASTRDLRTKSEMWFAEAFRDSKEVIQSTTDNTILGKGNFRFEQAMVPFLVRFSVKVDVKENKYRIQFYDVTYREGTNGATKDLEGLNEKKGRDKLKNNISSQFNSLIESYQKAMTKKDDF